jgi:hypothetical protein
MMRSSGTLSRAASGIATSLVACGTSLAAGAPAVQVIDFEDGQAGRAPSGFTATLTGQGRPGKWVVTAAPDAPSGRHVLAQTDADRTAYRFPVIVADNPSMADVDLTVHFKTISGDKDAAAGLVWRYHDAENYYIVRANALEDNVVLYKVENGKRIDLPIKGKGRTYGVDVKVSPRKWHTLRITAIGPAFKVALDGTELFEVEDRTFLESGRVGLWTKSDSVTWFDDFTIRAVEAR